jgi:hypothetical protein
LFRRSGVVCRREASKGVLARNSIVLGKCTVVLYRFEVKWVGDTDVKKQWMNGWCGRECEPDGYDVSTGSPYFKYFAISDFIIIINIIYISNYYFPVAIIRENKV